MGKNDNVEKYPYIAYTGEKEQERDVMKVDIEQLATLRCLVYPDTVKELIKDGDVIFRYVPESEVNPFGDDLAPFLNPIEKEELPPLSIDWFRTYFKDESIVVPVDVSANVDNRALVFKFVGAVNIATLENPLRCAVLVKLSTGQYIKKTFIFPYLG